MYAVGDVVNKQSDAECEGDEPWRNQVPSAEWADVESRNVPRVVRLFFVAVAINLLWEMAQMGLFASTGSWIRDSAECVRASLGDGGMVLGIYAVGALVFRRLDWFRRPGVAGYAVMLTIGVILATVFELAALRSGRWAYTSWMPRLPMMAGLGLLPMLQMMILPPIIFKIASALER